MEKRTAARIVGLAIFFILLAGAACFGLVMCSSGTPFEGMRTAALDTIVEQSGVKQHVEDKLHEHAESLAESTGVPVEFINAGIDMIDVTNWKVTSLPEDAVETASFDTTYEGQKIKLTTYEDPSYLTVTAYGQDITFDLPASTQTITEIAPYMSSLEDLGIPSLD